MTAIITDVKYRMALSLIRDLSDHGIEVIACHSGEKKAETLEGRIVALADRIAYINHDIDDACRGGMLLESDIPGEYKGKALQTPNPSHRRIFLRKSEAIPPREGNTRYVVLSVNGRGVLSANPDAWTYNRIWSPGRKYLP